MKTLIFEFKVETVLTDEELQTKFKDLFWDINQNPDDDIKLIEGKINIITDDKQAEASV